MRLKGSADLKPIINTLLFTEASSNLGHIENSRVLLPAATKLSLGKDGFLQQVKGICQAQTRVQRSLLAEPRPTGAAFPRTGWGNTSEESEVSFLTPEKVPRMSVLQKAVTVGGIVIVG